MSQQQSRMRWVTLHFALFQTAASLAGGFIGAYFLKSGFTLAAALVAYACYLALRSGLRFAAPALVRRIGYAPALMLGTTMMGLQYLPLMHADRPLWLGLWMLCVAVGEALYCPIYHATMAISCDSATRGRQLGLRTSLSTLISIVAPLSGAWMLTRFGPAATFSLATGLAILAVLPLCFLRDIPAGPVPSARETLGKADLLSMAAFAADGWLSAGLYFAWPMVLFASLGSQYGALGLSNAAAGLVGAGASYVCGRGIDRGHRGVYLNSVCLLLVAGVLLRGMAAWSTAAALTANLIGAAISALYVPVLMSTIYERAKRSGAAFRFHFAAEAGWDAGAVSGCLTPPASPGCAARRHRSPSMAGVGLMYLCVRADGRSGRRLAARPSGNALAT